MKRLNLAKLVGGGLAHFQHGIDRLTAWGFRAMRKAVNKPPEQTKATVRSRVFGAARKVFGFVGEAGDSFYEKYEELKRRGPN